MKKATGRKPLSETAIERYDWTHARRGRYAGVLAQGTAMRRLDDDLAKLFPNSQAVNAALRALVMLGHVVPRPRSRRGAAA